MCQNPGLGPLWWLLHVRQNQGTSGLSSRDLLGSSYTETYSAANGSEVTEQLHEQV